MTYSGLVKHDDALVEEQPWGRLQWMVAGRLGNSRELTVGICYIAPGEANPVHHHPNCDEVLHVLSGRITHRVGDEYFEMNAGDTVSIPTGSVHNATNIGQDEAVLMISFSSADRQTIGE